MPLNRLPTVTYVSGPICYLCIRSVPAPSPPCAGEKDTRFRDELSLQAMECEGAAHEEPSRIWKLFAHEEVSHISKERGHTRSSHPLSARRRGERETRSEAKRSAGEGSKLWRSSAEEATRTGGRIYER